LAAIYLFGIGVVCETEVCGLFKFWHLARGAGSKNEGARSKSQHVMYCGHKVLISYKYNLVW